MKYIERVAIYGVFQNGVCLYIGQTVGTRNRRCSHGKRFPGCEFRVLRWVPLPDADRIEKRTIAAYKRRGQAIHNKRIVGAPHYFASAYTVTVEGFDEPFCSISAAARALDIAGATFWRYYRQYGEYPYRPKRKIKIVEDWS